MSAVTAWLRSMARAGVAVGLIGGGLGAVLSAQQGASPEPAPLNGDVARGRYLVERVAMCGECHSSRDQAGTILPETRLRGGPMPVQVPWPADWPLQVPRIAGLTGYSDTEALRLLTQGAIKRNGTQARAPMPRFRMTHDDAAAVIAFLRTQ